MFLFHLLMLCINDAGRCSYQLLSSCSCFTLDMNLFLQFEDVIGVRILMVPIDECLGEKCESAGCSNRLVATMDPLLINTNGTSIVGITAYVEVECTCASREYEDNDLICRPDTCFNGGTCQRRGSGYR